MLGCVCWRIWGGGLIGEGCEVGDGVGWELYKKYMYVACFGLELDHAAAMNVVLLDGGQTWE